MSVQLVHLSAESRFLIVEVPVIAGRETIASTKARRSAS
jgi:hypothetical protein